MKGKGDSVRITATEADQGSGGRRESGRERRNRPDRCRPIRRQDAKDHGDRVRPEQPETPVKRRRHACGMSCTIVSGDLTGEIGTNDPLVEVVGDLLIADWIKKHLPRARQTLVPPVAEVSNETIERGERGA